MQGRQTCVAAQANLLIVKADARLDAVPGMLPEGDHPPWTLRRWAKGLHAEVLHRMKICGQPKPLQSKV